MDENILDENNKVTLHTNKNSKISLVGTVHISKETKENVRRAIGSLNPDTVAIELDSKRLYKLFDRQATFNDGTVQKPKLRSLITTVQQSENTVSVGEADMLTATNEAVKLDANLALIDMSVNELKSNIKSNVFKNGRVELELFNKSKDTIINNIKQYIDMSMKHTDIDDIVSDLENKPVNEVHTQFEPIRELVPEIVTELVDERDKYMAGRLYWLLENTDDDIVAIMGRGHIYGVYDLLKNPESIPSHYIVEPDWYKYSTIDIN